MSGVLKNKKSIGEIRDPCGIPAWIGKMSLVRLPSVIEVDLSVKKLLVHWAIYSETPLDLRLCSSRGWEMWSNAPATFSESRLAMFFLLQSQTVWTVSTSNSNAVSVNFPLQAPICCAGNKPCVSARSLSLWEKIVSSALPSVSNKAIGRYDLAKE